MIAIIHSGEYDLEIGRCVPGPNGEQLWYFQAWGGSPYPWWGEDGFYSADEALSAALGWDRKPRPFCP